MATRMIERLCRTRWTIATFCIVYGAHLARFISWVPKNYYPGGDGFYMYMLARSIAFDGDIDMSNDYATCGDPWRHGFDYGQGVPANPYYIGPATVWAPFLYVIRRLLPLAASASEAVRMGCTGPIPYTLGVVLAPLFAVLTTYLGYRIARRFVDRGPALIAVLVVGLGSGLNTFGPLWWNYSHVWAAAVVTAMALQALRVVEVPSSWSRWLVLGMFVGWSYLMRPHHAVWIFVPFVMTLHAMVAAIRERRVPFREAARGVLCLAGFALVGSVRALSYHALYGEYFPNLAGSVYVQPLHAHPFLVLFSARAGLLYQTPLMWFAVVGMGLACFHTKAARWARFVLVGLLLDFWVCSSALDWAGGATVGPRLLVSFTGLFVPFASVALERLWSWLVASEARLRRFAIVGWLVPALAVSWALFYGDPPYNMPSIYGSAVHRDLANVDYYVGNPFTLPATLVYALRYGAHPRTFDRVATPNGFTHTYDTGFAEHNGSDVIRFASFPPEVVQVEGNKPTPLGVRLDRRHRVGILAPLAWSTVTTVRVSVWASHRCSIRMTAGQFFYRTDLGRRRVRSGESVVTFHAPRRAFDSGINEVIIAASCPLDVRSLQWVDETETDQRTPTMLRRGAYLVHPG